MLNFLNVETITCTSHNAPLKRKKTSEPKTQKYMDDVEMQKQIEWNEIGKDWEFVLHDCPKNYPDPDQYTISGEEACSIEDKSYTQCWPMDWLPEQCPNLRIIGINYDTNLSFWTPMCPIDEKKNNLDQRSDDFLEELIAVGVGKKPIIWLAHSMGGLLVKNMLLKAQNSKNEEVRRVCENTKGLVFFSTPHKGSQAASINQTASYFIWPSVEVQELREGCPALLKLHNEFLDLLNKSKLKVISFVETESTTITPLKIQCQFVPTHSAKLNYGEYYEMQLDHLRICKPINRFSFLYRKVAMFIKDIVSEEQGKKMA